MNYTQVELQIQIHVQLSETGDHRIDLIKSKTSIACGDLVVFAIHVSISDGYVSVALAVAVAVSLPGSHWQLVCVRAEELRLSYQRASETVGLPG